MTRRVTAAGTAAAALALSALAMTGTAQAATPTVVPTASVTTLAQNPPPRPPPHFFRMKFRSQQQCFARAGRDHPGHRADWDCRRGPDRNNPWEYWGR